MPNKTPNHICKNQNCHKGSDGAPKHYWACNDCDKRNSWKKVACSEECYVGYLDAIAISRGKKSAEVDGQISLFDDEAPVAVEQDISADTAPVVEPKKDNGPAFMGYYSKKNKHR